MSIEQNKQTIRRIAAEIFEDGKLNVIDELFAPDYVEHSGVPGYDFGEGREGARRYITALREAFPDLCFEVLDLIAEGDKVVGYADVSGTFLKEFAGMKPTGKHAQWREAHICRMENGRVKEHWSVEDQLGMLQQLGVIPVPQVA
jgi:predicted ester cyclase